jgi:hypothetical protein
MLQVGKSAEVKNLELDTGNSVVQGLAGRFQLVPGIEKLLESGSSDGSTIFSADRYDELCTSSFVLVPPQQQAQLAHIHLIVTSTIAHQMTLRASVKVTSSIVFVWLFWLYPRYVVPMFGRKLNADLTNITGTKYEGAALRVMCIFIFDFIEALYVISSFVRSVLPGGSRSFAFRHDLKNLSRDYHSFIDGLMKLLFFRLPLLYFTAAIGMFDITFKHVATDYYTTTCEHQVDTCALPEAD